MESRGAPHRCAFPLSSALVSAPLRRRPNPLCRDAGIAVVAYSDDASGVEIERADGAGQFESVTLRPHAKLAAGSDETSRAACTMPPPRNALSRALCRSR